MNPLLTTVNRFTDRHAEFALFTDRDIYVYPQCVCGEVPAELSAESAKLASVPDHEPGRSAPPAFGSAAARAARRLADTR